MPIYWFILFIYLHSIFRSSFPFLISPYSLSGFVSLPNSPFIYPYSFPAFDSLLNAGFVYLYSFPACDSLPYFSLFFSRVRFLYQIYIYSSYSIPVFVSLPNSSFICLYSLPAFDSLRDYSLFISFFPAFDSVANYLFPLFFSRSSFNFLIPLYPPYSLPFIYLSISLSKLLYSTFTLFSRVRFPSSPFVILLFILPRPARRCCILTRSMCSHLR